MKNSEVNKYGLFVLNIGFMIVTVAVSPINKDLAITSKKN